MAELVSKIYSQAIFEVAEEDALIEQIKTELDFVNRVMIEYPEFYELLISPKISLDEKRSIVIETFKSHLSDQVMNFIKIIIDKKRITEFPDIVKEFNVMVVEKANVLVANVESVVPLTDHQKEEIKVKLRQMTGKNVEIDCTINQELIGGILIKIGDQIIDGSVRYKLEGMLESLTQIII